jgi:hypothetical protein
VQPTENAGGGSPFGAQRGLLDMKCGPNEQWCNSPESVLLVETKFSAGKICWATHAARPISQYEMHILVAIVCAEWTNPGRRL